MVAHNDSFWVSDLNDVQLFLLSRRRRLCCAFSFVFFRGCGEWGGMQQWGVEEGVSATTLTSRKHLSLSDLMTDLRQQPGPPNFSAASLSDLRQGDAANRLLLQMEQQQIWARLSCGGVGGFLPVDQPLLSRRALEGDQGEDALTMGETAFAVCERGQW